LATVSTLIADGLAKGESAVIITTKAHCSDLEQRIRLRGIDIEAVREQRRYAAFDASVALSEFMEKNGPDEKKFNRVIGNAIQRGVEASPHGSVRALGEIVQLLAEEGNGKAAFKLEQLWNILARKIPFNLHCAYSLDSFVSDREGGLFSRICAEHSDVIPTESYTRLRRSEQMRSVAYLQQKVLREAASLKSVQESWRLRERELSDFVASAVDSFQEIDSDGSIAWANSAQLDLLGYSCEEYLGRRLKEFYVDPKNFDEFWKKMLRGELVHDYPSRLKCKDGSIKDVIVRSNGYLDRKRFLYARCFVRDVTELVRLQTRLTSTMEKLAQTEHRMRQLTAILGDELYNPLVQVSNALSISRLDSKPSSTALETAQRKVAQMVRLVDFLLDVTNPDR
jgi:PAS domain S-box-containing protein